MVITWELRKFSDIAETRRGLTYKPTNTVNNGVRVLRSSNINEDTFVFGNEDVFVDENAVNIPFVQNGDILITSANGSSRLVGKHAIIRNLPNSSAVHGGFMLIASCSNPDFLNASLGSQWYSEFLSLYVAGGNGAIGNLNKNDLDAQVILVPSTDEQRQIGAYFRTLDHLITLHQRKLCYITFLGGKIMLGTVQKTDLFCDYYAKWITVYKKGAIRKVTLDKYNMTHSWLEKLIPTLKICELNRLTYQQLLNGYAEYHEKQTTMDFHHQLKGAILDAVDEGLIERDPTRKAIIKGKPPSVKKIKYLNQFELHKLLTSLDLKSGVNWDWLILLVAKTGMRFSEAIAITPNDFDFSHQTLSISKTWDYKGGTGFLPTKNKSSVRKIQIDWQTVIQFSELVKGLPEDKPIFVDGLIYNSTANAVLGRHCKKLDIPVISMHGLRHTHASILLFAGVSIASVARRLGHASMTTTQKTYLHIIQELENQDIDLVMRSLSGLS